MTDEIIVGLELAKLIFCRHGGASGLLAEELPKLNITPRTAFL
jgi:hypothetical protein